MLTYEQSTIVKLDGKVIGTIKTVAGGYQYFPKGHGVKWAGEVFETLEACKASLED